MKAAEDEGETVALLAPLLLPKGTAQRLFFQAQKEEAEEIAARLAAEAALASSTNDQKVRLQLTPIVRVKSINSQPASASSKESLGVDEVHPESPGSAQTGSGSGGSPGRPGSQRDSHRSHRSQSRESHSRGSRRNSGSSAYHSPRSRKSMVGSSEGRPGSSLGALRWPAINTSPWLGTNLAPANEELTLREDLSDWPPEVLQLFGSVEQGCHRMRCAVSRSITFRAQRHQKLVAQRAAAAVKAADCIVRSRSDPTLLPRVSRPSADVGKEKRYRMVAAACRAVPAKDWGRCGRASSAGTRVADRRCGSSPEFSRDSTQQLSITM